MSWYARRRIIVEADAARLADIERLFAPLGRAMDDLCRSCGPAERRVIRGFIERALGFLGEEAERLRSAPAAADEAEPERGR